MAAPPVAGIAGRPVLYRDGVEVQLYRFPDRTVVFHIGQAAYAQQRMAYRRAAEQGGVFLYRIDCYYVSVSRFHLPNMIWMRDKGTSNQLFAD